MNSFGLGLVLNFVDHASAGMNTATSNFNRMSATADNLTSSVSASATEIAAIAFSLGAVGDTFTSIGESVMGVFTGITQSVIDTGGEMLNYRMQMTALYGSIEAGEAKMEEIKQYAMSSVFGIQSLIPAVTMMKTVGIEALDEITTSSGSATQKLLDYASDLAAMMPNMRNVYGTGVEAAMGAFKEYIAEGNAMSLKRGAGLDITQILGEDKGKTIEERTQQVADLIDKLNIVGYTANLAGTPTQRLSNMQDALFNSLSKIADSGVFEAYCVLLETLSDWVFSLVENEETFNVITGVLADTITTLLSPLQAMLDWLVKNSDAIINWVKENPKLTKNILLTVAAIGALLIVGGSLLKLLSSISFAKSGLGVLKSLPMLFGKIVGSILPFIAIASLLYTAWDKNIGGIKDKITGLFKTLVSTISLIADAWSDNTLSEDKFNKAKEMGILPLIETILDLKYRFDFFKQGFIKGWTDISAKVVNAMGAIVGVLGGTVFEPIIKKITEFFTKISEADTDSWFSFGEGFAKIAGIGALIPDVLSFVQQIVVFLGDVIVIVAELIAGVLPAVIQILTTIMGVVIKLLPIIMRILSTVMNLISALLPVATKLIDMLLPFIIQFVDMCAVFIDNVLVIIVDLLETIIPIIMDIADLLIPMIMEILDCLMPIISSIMNIVMMLGSRLFPIIQNLMVIVSAILKTVMNVLKPIITIIMQIVEVLLVVLLPVIDVIITAIGFVIDIILGIVQAVVSVVSVIITIVTGIINVIVSILDAIIQAIMVVIGIIVGAIRTVVGTISNIIKAIIVVFQSVWDAIVSTFSNVVDFFRGVFQTAFDAVSGFFRKVADFFTGIWNGIVSAFSAIGDTISGAIKSAINGVLSGAVKIINGFIESLNFAIGIINAIPGVNITKLTLLTVPQLAEGGVVDKPTVAQIGEDGEEAVVPLKNNTEWTDKVAEKLAPKLIAQPNIQANSNKASEEHNDYSVTFAAGSIVIQIVNATDSELEKAAEKIMKIIARKQQLRAMAVRG